MKYVHLFKKPLCLEGGWGLVCNAKNRSNNVCALESNAIPRVMHMGLVGNKGEQGPDTFINATGLAP